ncbi:MAG: hypothetical protein ACWA5U_01115 [bacterium]
MPNDPLSSEEALQHIQGMRHMLLDRQGNLPIPTGHFFLWSIISALLIIALPFLFKSSINLSMIAFILMVLFGLLGLGGWILSYLINKENNKRERGWGAYQKLIIKIGFFNIFFAAIMTMVLGSFLEGLLVNSIWMFVLGMTYMIIGFFSRAILTQYGIGLMILSLIFSMIAYSYLLYMNDPATIPTQHLAYIHQIDTLLGLISISGGHLMLGIYFLKKQPYV